MDLDEAEDQRARLRFFLAKRMFERLDGDPDIGLKEIFKKDVITLMDCIGLMCSFDLEPHQVYLLAASHGKEIPEEEVLKDHSDWKVRLRNMKKSGCYDEMLEELGKKLEEKRDEDDSNDDSIDHKRGYTS